LTVAEAADVLNISQDAVRKRIARGTIRHDRDETGRVYVYLSPSETVHKTDQDSATKTVQDAYIRSLEDQIAFLRRELERKDGILLNLTERIPQLEAARSEAPSQGSESPVRDSGPGPTRTPTNPDAGAHGEAQGVQGPIERPWWRRVLGR
jgi:excisionase family DNA binding protein